MTTTITPALCSPEYLAQLRARTEAGERASTAAQEVEWTRNLLEHIDALQAERASVANALGRAARMAWTDLSNAPNPWFNTVSAGDDTRRAAMAEWQNKQISLARALLPSVFDDVDVDVTALIAVIDFLEGRP